MEETTQNITTNILKKIIRRKIIFLLLGKRRSLVRLLFITSFDKASDLSTLLRLLIAHIDGGQ